jgi:hypothetical protein
MLLLLLYYIILYIHYMLDIATLPYPSCVTVGWSLCSTKDDGHVHIRDLQTPRRRQGPFKGLGRISYGMIVYYSGM